VSGLVLQSLVCLVLAGNSAEAMSTSSSRNLTLDGSQSQSDAARREVLPLPDTLDLPGTLVVPNRDPLVIELGRSRLLHFPDGIRRTALSNAAGSEVVQVGPKDVLILGRRQGVADLTVWPASSHAGPSVIVVRVERKPRLGE